MTKGKWKKYTGSDEQIEEMRNAKDGYTHRKNKQGKSEYIINDPHPYANEIKIWSDTGCPVYWKDKEIDSSGECGSCHYPFAQPGLYEYRLTPFED